MFTVALTGGLLMPWVSGQLAEMPRAPWAFVVVAGNITAIAAQSVLAKRIRRGG